MTRVSKKKVKRNIFSKMSRQLVGVIAGLETKKNATGFLDDLLTKEEKIVLAKRLALIFMLERGYSFSAIEETLKMSPTTITRTWRNIKNNKYPSLMKIMEKEKKKEAFWLELEKLIRLGLPPKSGPGRWYDIPLEEQIKKRRKGRII